MVVGLQVYPRVQVSPSSQAYETENCKQRLHLIVAHVGHEGLHVGSYENSLKSVKPHWLVCMSEGMLKPNSQEDQVSDMLILSGLDFTVRKELLFQC